MPGTKSFVPFEFNPSKGMWGMILLSGSYSPTLQLCHCEKIKSSLNRWPQIFDHSSFQISEYVLASAFMKICLLSVIASLLTVNYYHFFWKPHITSRSPTLSGFMKDTLNDRLYTTSEVQTEIRTKLATLDLLPQIIVSCIWCYLTVLVAAWTETGHFIVTFWYTF